MKRNSKYAGTAWGLFGWFWEWKKPKRCKRCNSIELEHFAGIGADGLYCLKCEKVQ